MSNRQNPVNKLKAWDVVNILLFFFVLIYLLIALLSNDISNRQVVGCVVAALVAQYNFWCLSRRKII